MLRQLPVIKLFSENSGLTQNSIMKYVYDERGRSRIFDEKDTSHIVTRTIRICLPLILMPETWERHKYSFEDVVDTLNAFKTNQLWQLAVVFGIPMSNSSVKLSFMSPTSIVFTSKAGVLSKISEYVRNNFNFPMRNVLDRAMLTHEPPVPVHSIPFTLFESICHQLQSSTETHSAIRVNTISDTVHLMGVDWVPIGMEGKYVYMIRAIEKSVFEKSLRDTSTIASKPLVFITKKYGPDYQFYGCIDEPIFIQYF